MTDTVSDQIVKELAAAGIETLFGVISIHNMPIYDAIHRRGGFRVVAARTEGGAVNMADAYARVSGRTGLAITSTGTAAGNAAGALIEAWSAGSPVLHLTGQVASPYVDSGRGYIHEPKDQLGMLKSVGKDGYRLRHPVECVPVVRRALREVGAAPAGPISIEIPIDFQSAVLLPPENDLGAGVAPPFPKAVDLEFSARLATESKRPVLWTGGGAIAASAGDRVLELAELIGAPVITSQSGKGIIPETHPLCLGHFATNPIVRELIEAADLLISVGVRFRGHETANWSIRVPHDHIRIDADASATRRNYPPTIPLVGDARSILDVWVPMIRSLAPDPWPTYRAEVTSVRKRTRQGLRETLGPYEAVLDAIREVLPETGILVRDVTVQTSLWGSRLIEIRKPRTSIHAAGGGIGQGLPMAIGAQMAKPDELVLLMVGDGGFLVSIGELATARQESLPIVIVLFDDAGYGVLRNIQNAAFEGRNIGVDLESPDFVSVAHAFGFAAQRIDSAAAFHAALREAAAVRRPTLLVLDVRSIGPMRRPFQGPPGGMEILKPHQ